MIIRNGIVFKEDGTFRKEDVFIENHRIVASEAQVTDPSEIQADGLLVLPGLVDIHSHGAFGHDFSDADTEGLKTILKYEKSCGITSYCPTSMTLPAEELKSIFATAKEAAGTEDGAVIRGINMEGPFLDPKKKGAHVEAHIRKADAGFFRDLNKASGNMVKLVTLAPNTEGAMDFIDEVVRYQNVRVKGLMTIAPFVDDPESNRKHFANLHKLLVDIRKKKVNNVTMNVLSMGMTNDFEVAIEEGATMVRVGTAIFGERNYVQ